MAQDITKTGKQNYRQLQEQNAKEQSGTPDNGNNEFTLRGSIANFRQRAASEAANEIAAEGTPRVVKSPIFQRTGGEDYVGNSMWDEDLYYGNNLEDPNNTSFDNTRGENQWGIAQLGAGIGKGIALAGTTFVDGLVGLGYGLVTGGGKAINEFNDENKSGLDKLFDATAGLFDNDVSNAINEVTKEMEQILPNYRTDEENDNPWYSNLGTANFWGDSFIKNLGFTVGAFYSGNALNKALKAAHVLKSGIGASVAGSLLSAVNEGRIEANNTMHDYQDLEDAKTKDAYDKRVGEILDSDLTDAEKNAMLEDLDANYQAQLQDNAERSRRAGVIDLALNVPILTLSNFYSLGRLYARGFGNAERKAAGGFRFGREHADQDIAGRVSRNADGTLSFKKYGTASKLWRTAKIGLSEGNEELAQQMASNFGGDIESYDDPDIYYKALVNPDVRRDTMDTMGALIKSFDDSYLDLDQWEQFAVGALTGLMGMPTFGRVNNSDKNAWLGRGKAIALSGGAPAVFGNLNEANARGEQFVNQINDFEAKYRKKVQDGANPFVLSKVFTDAMSGFAEDQDEFNFQNMSDNDMFAVIQAYGQTGRLDDLASLIDMDFENMSDEQLEKIAKSTTTADNTGSGWKNPDGSLMPDTEEGGEKMRSKLIEKRDKIKAQIKSYEDALESVRAIGNNSLPDDAMQELAWLKWKTVAFGDRLQQVKKENKSLFDTLRSNFENRVSILEDEKGKTTSNPSTATTEEIVYDNDIVDKEQYRLRVLTQLRQTAPKPGTKMPDGHTLTEEEYENGLQDAAKKAAEDYEKKMLEEGRAKKMSSLEANDIQRKNLTDAIEVLDYLLEGNVSDKLKGMLKDNKRINELFNVLGQAIYYDNLLGDDLTEEDFEKARTAMRDAIRITTARRTFMKRLNEYRKDPLALSRNRRKIDNENAKKEKTKQDIQNDDEIDNASVQDIVQGADDGDYVLDGLDDIIEQSESETEEERKAKASRKGKVKAAKDIIERRGNAINKLGAIKGRDPKTLRTASNMINESSKRAERKEDVLDTDNVAWNDRNDLDDELKKEISKLPAEEREARIIEEISKAKEVAKELQQMIDEDDAMAGQLGDIDDEAPDTSGTPSSRFTFGPERSPQRGNGNRASNDTGENQDAGDPVDVNDETLKRKSKQEKIDIVKKKIFNDPYSYLENIPATEDVVRVMTAAIKMRNKKASITDILDQIQQMQSYAALDEDTKAALKLAISKMAISEINGVSVDGFDWIGSGKESSADDIAETIGHGGNDDIIGRIEFIDDLYHKHKTRKQVKAEIEKKDGYDSLPEADKTFPNNLVDNVYDRRCLEFNADAKEDEKKDDNDSFVANKGDANASQESIEKSEETQQPVYNYWKPTTTQFGMHDPKGRLRSFYETALILNNIIKKIGNKEQLTDEENELRMNYLGRRYGGNGFISNPYTQQQLRRMKAIYDYFEKHNVFENLNNGKAEIKAGSTVHFFIDSDLNDEAGETIILMANDKGQVIGDLMMPSDRAQGKQAKLREFEQKVIKEWEEAGKPSNFTSKYTSKIRELKRGKVPFGNVRHRAVDIGITDFAVYSVSRWAKGKGDFVICSNKSIPHSSIVFPMTKVNGQPFLIIKDFCGTKYTCVPFYTNPITSETPKTTPLLEACRAIMRQIVKDQSGTNLGAMKLRMQILFGGEFNVNVLNSGLLVIKHNKKFIYNAPINEIEKDIEGETQKAFDGLSMVVTTALFGNSLNIGSDFSKNYLAILANEAQVNVPYGTESTINNWFLVEPDYEVNEQPKSPAIPPSDQGRHTPIDVNYNGETFSVEINDDGIQHWTISQSGSLTPNEQNIIKAHAYGIVKGADMSVPYHTPLGWYDPNTMQFGKKPDELNSEDPATIALIEKTAAGVFDGLTVEYLRQNLDSYLGTSNEELSRLWKQSQERLDVERKAGMEADYYENVSAMVAIEHIFRTYDANKFEEFLYKYTTDQQEDLRRAMREEYERRHGAEEDTINRDKQELEARSDTAWSAYEDAWKQTQRENKINLIEQLIKGKVGDNKFETTRLMREYPSLTRKYEELIKKVAFNDGVRNGDFSWDDLSDDDLDMILGLLNDDMDAIKKSVQEEDESELDKLINEYRKKQVAAGADNAVLMPTYRSVKQKLIDFGIIDSDWKLEEPIKEKDGGTLKELEVGMAKNIYNKVRKALEKKADKETLKSATFDKIFSSYSNTPEAVDNLISRLQDAVNDGKLTIDEAMVFVESLLEIHGDDRAEFFERVHPDIIAEQQGTKERDYDKEASDAKLLVGKKNREKWGRLSNDQKKRILDDVSNDRKEDCIKQLFSNPLISVDDVINAHVKRNMLVTKENKNDPRGDLKKEVDSLAKAIPQLGIPGAIRVTHSLIRVGENTYAYGMFANGIVTLSENAVQGVVYHEGFHFVFRMLFTDEEQNDILKAAKKVYGDLNDLELEEKLAEDFRMYSISRETSREGVIKRFFRKLLAFVKRLAGDDTMTNKNLIRAFYGHIWGGDYMARDIRTNYANRRTYGPVSRDIIKNKENLEYINEEKESLESDMKNAQSKAWKKAVGIPVVFDGKQYKPYDGVVYRSEIAALKAIPKSYASVVEVFQYGNSYGIYVMDEKAMTDAYKETRKGLDAIAKEIKNHISGMEEMKTPVRGKKLSEDLGTRALSKVRVQYWNQYKYDNLSQSRLEFLKDRGVSKEEYDSMPLEMREVMFKCMA